LSVRAVFRSLSLLASALYSRGLFEFIPKAARMTPRNSVFKANRHMLTAKAFSPEMLQVARQNLNDIGMALDPASTCVADPGSHVFDITAGVLFSPADNTPGLKVHWFIYDHVRGIMFDYDCNEVPNQTDNFSITTAADCPSDFNTPQGSQLADCRFYQFVTREDGNGKRFITQTVSFPVTM